MRFPQAEAGFYNCRVAIRARPRCAPLYRPSIHSPYIFTNYEDWGYSTCGIMQSTPISTRAGIVFYERVLTARAVAMA
jgi:hypothetical protein